jgi:phosphomevalonate kinase
MSSLVASAPGKIVLCGEYVVLDGAPAIAAAVNARAVANVIVVDSDDCSLAVSGFRDGEYAFRVDAGGAIRWTDEAAQQSFSLFETVWAHCRPAAPIGVRIDTQAFSHPGTAVKLGLGSSAAVTVALSAVLGGGVVGSADELVELHRDFQGGRGSGVDIATSLTGGVIEYRMQQCEVVQREWPAGLHYRILWSGVAAATTDKLAVFDGSSPSKISRRRLADASERLAETWQQPAANVLLDDFADYVAALSEFDADYGLGIMDAGHAELIEMAQRCGVMYKPCGAGGGDTGIVLSDDPDRLSDFVAQALARGFYALDNTIDPVGLKIGGNAS